jgi:hypothetical protein
MSMPTASLVDEGLRHLSAMLEAYGVTPGKACIEHYGCAIDMLRRPGWLDKEEVLIVVMPVPPDALVQASSRPAACGTTSIEPTG